jgi:hypothetical protein
LKCDGTRWSTWGEVKWKLPNAVGSQYPSHYLGTWCMQHYYRWRAHLALTPPIEMDSSVSPKDETWFLSVCHHISNALYLPVFYHDTNFQSFKQDQFLQQHPVTAANRSLSFHIEGNWVIWMVEVWLHPFLRAPLDGTAQLPVETASPIPANNNQYWPRRPSGRLERINCRGLRRKSNNCSAVVQSSDTHNFGTYCRHLFRRQMRSALASDRCCTSPLQNYDTTLGILSA